jgi:hypothetical protein
VSVAPKVSWEALRNRPLTPVAAAIERTADTPEEMVWRAVSGGLGADLLEWLRSETIEKRDPADATDAQLRESEANRRLVAKIENMRDRGAEIAAARIKNKTGL